MNEDFEKWWDDYIKKYMQLPLTITGLFYAFSDCWNASRASMKEKRFGCHLPIYGVLEICDQCPIGNRKESCKLWREVEG